MTPSMEDYAALARAIGMELRPNRLLSEEYWFDRNPHQPIRAALPAYLAEPEQMSRILRAKRINVLPADDGKWVGSVWANDSGGFIDALADTPEEACRDAAALALRAKRNG
jgi:hypothetical protein